MIMELAMKMMMTRPLSIFNMKLIYLNHFEIWISKVAMAEKLPEMLSSIDQFTLTGGCK